MKNIDPCRFRSQGIFCDLAIQQISNSAKKNSQVSGLDRHSIELPDYLMDGAACFQSIRHPEFIFIFQTNWLFHKIT